MAYEKGYVATLAEMEAWYADEPAGAVLELMNQTNDILSDVQWLESNQTDGHKTRIRTGLPEVYWRRIYRGTPPSKSEWSVVTEQCGMLEARMELDIAEVEMYGDRAKDFRMSESLAFTESMRQKVATTLFYGNNEARPDEFNGLSMRYPSLSSPNVVDGGGTSGNMTSLWLISWGANSVHGIYPKGSQGGLRHKVLPEYMTTDDSGNKFQCVGDIYNWKCGLAVRDWRAVVRVANIPVANLTKRKGEEGFIDLQAITIEAKNKMPQNLRDRAIWYCNQDVLTGLELQSTDAGNVTLEYGQYFSSKAIPALHGRPIRQCDAILSTETKLDA